MRPVVLYRNSNSPAEDMAERAAIVKAGFPLITNRGQIKAGDLVIPRYSAWPFFKELVEDCLEIGAQTINTLANHNYIADLKNWVIDLKELTPDTWDRLEHLPEEGPFILKGATNSKKGYWRTHMFAKNKSEANLVHSRLCADGLIGDQTIYVRKFIKLHTYTEDLAGCPISKEFRFFIYNQRVLSSGFYWSNFVEEINPPPSPEEVPSEFIQIVLKRIGDKAKFYAVDVAQSETGEWLVIEINDGMMSGLSCNNPEVLYGNLYKELSCLIN